jgi:hypothetical protein
MGWDLRCITAEQKFSLGLLGDREVWAAFTGTAGPPFAEVTLRWHFLHAPCQAARPLLLLVASIPATSQLPCASRCHPCVAHPTEKLGDRDLAWFIWGLS